MEHLGQDPNEHCRTSGTPQIWSFGLRSEILRLRARRYKALGLGLAGLSPVQSPLTLKYLQLKPCPQDTQSCLNYTLLHKRSWGTVWLSALNLEACGRCMPVLYTLKPLALTLNTVQPRFLHPGTLEPRTLNPLTKTPLPKKKKDPRPSTFGWPCFPQRSWHWRAGWLLGLEASE